MKKNLLAFLVILAMPFALGGCNKSAAVSDLVNTSDFSTEVSNQIEVSNRTEVSESINNAIPESYMITSDNYIDYQQGLECSAFSSAYLLRHYGEEADGVTLYENFPGRLPEGGAMPYGIEEFFNEHGYEASFKSDGTVEMLKELISDGSPVIVFIHVEEPYESTHNTHYIPLVGYDKDYFYFAESLSDYANCKEEKNVPYNRKTEISKFKRLWENIDGTWDYPYFVITKI